MEPGAALMTSDFHGRGTAGNETSYHLSDAERIDSAVPVGASLQMCIVVTQISAIGGMSAG